MPSPPQFRKDYGTSKYVPVDLRRKRTRAIRRALTVKEVRFDCAVCNSLCCWNLVPSPAPLVHMQRTALTCVLVPGICVLALVQKSIKSKRQATKEANFPRRRYAVAAQA